MGLSKSNNNYVTLNERWKAKLLDQQSQMVEEKVSTDQMGSMAGDRVKSALGLRL